VVLVRRMTDGEDAAAAKEADGVTDLVG
jgi:hypothetical protein